MNVNTALSYSFILKIIFIFGLGILEMVENQIQYSKVKQRSVIKFLVAEKEKNMWSFQKEANCERRSMF